MDEIDGFLPESKFEGSVISLNQKAQDTEDKGVKLKNQGLHSSFHSKIANVEKQAKEENNQSKTKIIEKEEKKEFKSQDPMKIIQENKNKTNHLEVEGKNEKSAKKESLDDTKNKPFNDHEVKKNFANVLNPQSNIKETFGEDFPVQVSDPPKKSGNQTKDLNQSKSNPQNVESNSSILLKDDLKSSPRAIQHTYPLAKKTSANKKKLKDIMLISKPISQESNLLSVIITEKKEKDLETNQIIQENFHRDPKFYLSILKFITNSIDKNDFLSNNTLQRIQNNLNQSILPIIKQIICRKCKNIFIGIKTECHHIVCLSCYQVSILNLLNLKDFESYSSCACSVCGINGSLEFLSNLIPDSKTEILSLCIKRICNWCHRELDICKNHFPNETKCKHLCDLCYTNEVFNNSTSCFCCHLEYKNIKYTKKRTCSCYECNRSGFLVSDIFRFNKEGKCFCLTCIEKILQMKNKELFDDIEMRILISLINPTCPMCKDSKSVVSFVKCPDCKCIKCENCDLSVNSECLCRLNEFN